MSVFLDGGQNVISLMPQIDNRFDDAIINGNIMQSNNQSFPGWVILLMNPKPRVILYLVNGVPLKGVSVQNLGNQILGFVREELRKLVIAFHDFSVKLLSVLIIKRKVSA